MMEEQTATPRINALIKVGRYAEAATLARQSLATSPESASLNMLLSVASCEIGEYEQAVDAAQRAVALKPENYVAHRTLGWATYKVGRGDEAKQILERALALNPDDLMTHVMLADVLLRTIPRGIPSANAEAFAAGPGDRPPRHRGNSPRS